MALMALFAKTPVVLLKEYCNSNNLPPPVYSINQTRTHKPRYRCSVQVGEHTFSLANDFATTTDAHQSVAREAFLILIGELTPTPDTEEQSTYEGALTMRRFERATSKGQISACDFMSVWGNVVMPWWSNYEILQSRLKVLGGFSYLYVLSEIAKANGIPLDFDIRGPEGRYTASIEFRSRTFKITRPRQDPRECKQDLAKEIVQSLLGRTGPKVIISTNARNLTKFNSGHPVLSHEAANNTNTNISDISSSTAQEISSPGLSSANALSSLKLYSEVAKIPPSSHPTPGSIVSSEKSVPSEQTFRTLEASILNIKNIEPSKPDIANSQPSISVPEPVSKVFSSHLVPYDSISRELCLARLPVTGEQTESPWPCRSIFRPQQFSQAAVPQHLPLSAHQEPSHNQSTTSTAFGPSNFFNHQPITSVTSLSPTPNLITQYSTGTISQPSSVTCHLPPPATTGMGSLYRFNPFADEPLSNTPASVRLVRHLQFLYPQIQPVTRYEQKFVNLNQSVGILTIMGVGTFAGRIKFGPGNIGIGEVFEDAAKVALEWLERRI